MRLSHLLLVIGLECLFMVPLASIQILAGATPSFQKRLWFTIVPAMAMALAVAWPVARRLGIPPLMVFAGPCPGCRQRPPGWWNSSTDRDRLQLTCGACGARVTVWLASSLPPDITALDVPTYVLRWPQYLGVWRRVDAEGN
jgi:hypothetical protein